MACEAPPGECLTFHVKPRIPGATQPRRDDESRRWFLTAPCPAHPDRKPSFKISEGDHRKFIWWCYAGCSERKIRHALIDVCKVPRECLPRSAAELRDLEESLYALLTSDLSHADVRLRALALLDSPGGELPKRGSDLAVLAAAAHVSRSGAFRARGDGPTVTTK